jgi:CsoR family transcriptional regulator, copper-sensing transcriptional repressor
MADKNDSAQRPTVPAGAPASASTLAQTQSGGQAHGTVQGRTQILNRLKSVDGHLRGVIKMVEEDVYCMDVIKQLQAVQSAIGRVNALLLEDHLRSCVTTAVRGDDAAERTRVMAELLALFEQGATTSDFSPVSDAPTTTSLSPNRGNGNGNH